MRQTYRVVAGLIAVGVLVQAASIAAGWFQVIGSDAEAGAVYETEAWFNLGHLVHLFVGLYAMPVLGLVLLLVSFPASTVVRGARSWGALVLGLIVLQVALAFLAVTLVPAIGALHGVNALLVLGAALRAVSLTRGATQATTGASLPGRRGGSGSAADSSVTV